MKVAIYSSITAAKDSLKEPLNRSGADLVIFSDRPWAEPGWDVRPACAIFADPRRNARAHKLLAHQYLPDYDYSLWIDGSIRLLVAVRDLIETYLAQSDIVLFQHSVRECIYDEAAVCAALGLDDPAVIAAQMEKYVRKGHPSRSGLHESGVVLRRHNSRIESFNDAWWSELNRYSCRDQLSLDYVLRRQDISPAAFPGTIYDNPGLFAYEGHQL